MDDFSIWRMDGRFFLVCVLHQSIDYIPHPTAAFIMHHYLVSSSNASLCTSEISTRYVVSVWAGQSAAQVRCYYRSSSFEFFALYSDLPASAEVDT